MVFRLSNFGVRGLVSFVIGLVPMTGATAIPGTPMFENDWGDTSCGGGEI